MKVLLLVTACAFALLAASSPCAAEMKTIQRMTMDMPTVEERRMGARPWRGVSSSAAQRQQGRSRGLTIINGSKAKAGQFPWMLSMIVDESFFCGASIISSNWVLTAGHCIDGAQKFTITAGSLKPMDGQEPTMQVVKATGDNAYPHPNYDTNFLDNDIGLIELLTAFIFDDYVSAIRLPSYSMAVDMMVGHPATISGWGLTSDDPDAGVADTLMFAEMTIDNGDACYSVYENIWYSTKLCFSTAKDHKSTCQGDSGGPLVVQEDDGIWTEIGLTSFGSSIGCSAGYPVVFTRVASFLDFIESTTGLEARQ